jgi:hypothetical protein
MGLVFLTDSGTINGGPMWSQILDLEVHDIAWLARKGVFSV